MKATWPFAVNATSANGNRLRFRALFVPAVLLLSVPFDASAVIYKWVDETGRTVYSNLLPKDKNARNVQIAVEEETAPASASTKEVAPAERELQQRISSLENQVQDLQYQIRQQAAVAAPPPPPPDYYSNAYYGSYPFDYGGYPYPAYYSYPYAIFPGTVVIRRAPRFVSRRFISPRFISPRFVSPRFVSRPFVSFHRPGMGRR